MLAQLNGWHATGWRGSKEKEVGIPQADTAAWRAVKSQTKWDQKQEQACNTHGANTKFSMIRLSVLQIIHATDVKVPHIQHSY